MPDERHPDRDTSSSTASVRNAGQSSPTKVLVRQYAQHICDVSGIATKIGHNWWDRFITRHPEVMDSKSSGLRLRWRKGWPLRLECRPTAARDEASVENSGEIAQGLTTVARSKGITHPRFADGIGAWDRHSPLACRPGCDGGRVLGAVAPTTRCDSGMPYQGFLCDKRLRAFGGSGMALNARKLLSCHHEMLLHHLSHPSQDRIDFRIPFIVHSKVQRAPDHSQCVLDLRSTTPTRTTYPRA